MTRIVVDQVEIFPFRRRGGTVEFLMLQRARGDRLGGTWHAVHGSIEPGETAVQAALRELYEESGLTPLRFWQIDFVSTFFLADLDCVCLNPVFTAEIDPAAEVRLSDEHEGFRWVAADEAPGAFMWPNQRRALREIMDEVITPGLAEPYLRIALDDDAGRPGTRKTPPP